MPSAPSSSSVDAELAGYEIVVGVTGGIAAYKVCEVVSKLVQRGVGVTVAMTRSARRFVGPTTFQALTARRVLTSMWSADQPGDVQHIQVTDVADLIIVAPATSNLLAKVAAGIADDLVTTLIVSAASPVMMVPAMNARMWANPIVQRNVSALAELGYRIVAPGEGWLACRTVGPGRMAEPDEIIDAVAAALRVSEPKRVLST